MHLSIFVHYHILCFRSHIELILHHRYFCRRNKSESTLDSDDNPCLYLTWLKRLQKRRHSGSNVPSVQLIYGCNVLLNLEKWAKSFACTWHGIFCFSWFPVTYHKCSISLFCLRHFSWPQHCGIGRSMTFILVLILKVLYVAS